MGGTMGRTLAAGTAVLFFVIALVAFGMSGDRIAVLATLIGFIALSLAILVHVSDLGPS